MPIVTFVGISQSALEKASPELLELMKKCAVLRHWWLDEAKYVFQEVAGLPGSCVRKGVLPRLSEDHPLHDELQKLKKEGFIFEVYIEHFRPFFRDSAEEEND